MGSSRFVVFDSCILDQLDELFEGEGNLLAAPSAISPTTDRYCTCCNIEYRAHNWLFEHS
jgi:hypothetical protein